MPRRLQRTAMLLAATGASLLTACTAPPPPFLPYTAVPPIHARPHPRQTTARCGPDRQALNDAQKAALFQDFDTWQRAHHDPADPAPRPLPPPGPEQRTAALQACRAKSS